LELDDKCKLTKNKRLLPWLDGWDPFMRTAIIVTRND